MNMKTLALIFGFLLCLIVACVPVRVVSSEEDPDVNFRDYETFGFYDLAVEDRDQILFSEPDFSRLKKAITHEMELRDFTLKDKDPDLMINLGLIIEELEQTRETDFRDARLGYTGQRNYHWESEEVVVNKYESGTVKVDMVDRKENVMLWQGVIMGNITKNDQKMDARVNKGISDLFKKFPIQPN